MAIKNPGSWVNLWGIRNLETIQISFISIKVHANHKKTAVLSSASTNPEHYLNIFCLHGAVAHSIEL